tara:strand:+ start:380 stop:667 length:288 start_codon:yes stop_codon:yes gene_type:complete
MTNTHKCSICQCEFTEDEGGSEGYIGILPVSFCPTCLNGIYDMVEQTADPLELESLTDEEIQRALGVTAESSNWNMIMVLEWAKKIEAALLEKNT